MVNFCNYSVKKITCGEAERLVMQFSCLKNRKMRFYVFPCRDIKLLHFFFPFGRRFSDPEFELLAEVCQVSKAYLLGYF